MFPFLRHLVIQIIVGRPNSMDIQSAIDTVINETLGDDGVLVRARCARDVELNTFERINTALDFLSSVLRDCDTFDRRFVIALVILSQEIPQHLGAFENPSNVPFFPPRQPALNTSQKVLEFVEDWNRYGDA